MLAMQSAAGGTWGAAPWARAALGPPAEPRTSHGAVTGAKGWAHHGVRIFRLSTRTLAPARKGGSPARASADSVAAPGTKKLTCRQCKKSFDPATNTPTSCAFHPAHYGGEIKRKWKSYKYHEVGAQFLYHSEETKAEWGEVQTYWDCCARPDPMDLGCEVGPHRSYDE